MEYNVHRLTLYSPARESLPRLALANIDIDQVLLPLLHL